MVQEQNNILFEKFEILTCLKKDGYASVYIANHIYLGKKIFLKTLAKDHISDSAILNRFQREAKLLAKLDHPNIIKVFDFGTYKNNFYISFEYFLSRNLRVLINDDKSSFNDKLNIFVQITKGLSAAHKYNIIHRDIKPENILVNDKLQVKIADFGLALVKDDINLTRQESIVGTPGYMSPEQIRGETLTPVSDLFSLGIVGCELFSGKNPFLGKDAGSTINNILSKNCSQLFKNEKPGPAPVYDVIQSLLQKNKQKRPQSADEILTKLGVTEQIEPSKPAPVAVKKKRLPVYSLAVLFFVLIIVMSVKYYLDNKSPGYTAATKDSVVVEKRERPAPVDSVSQPGYTIKQSEKNETILQPEKDSLIASPSPQTNSSTTPQLDLPGKLFIQCAPWADIYIDSVKIQTTPLEDHISLLAGSHELTLQHPEYPPYNRTININPRQEMFVSVNLDTLIGYLECLLYPWGDVYINNEFKGQTPLPRPIRLLPGRHLLTIKNDNYGKIDELIQINKKDTLKFKFNFELLVSKKDHLQP
ncbi:serine/threonine protein kinase [candidate division KSB1 bacterium]|nr:serine/threonine protein kinase [candidate division KSB1 bacterium]